MPYAIKTFAADNDDPKKFDSLPRGEKQLDEATFATLSTPARAAMERGVAGEKEVEIAPCNLFQEEHQTEDSICSHMCGIIGDFVVKITIVVKVQQGCRISAQSEPPTSA